MRILSDSEYCLSEFVGADVPRTNTGLSLLGETEKRVWNSLSSAEIAWTVSVDGGQASSFWRRLVMIERACRSQFDALHEALADGLSLDGPTVALALSGEQFRGQRGRPWSAVEGNLFLTVGLPVGLPVAEVMPGLVMLPAVSVIDAIHASGGSHALPSIKWVNDILIDGRKVAGVLASTICRDGVVEACVLGLGVNNARAPSLEPTPFVPSAGDLKDSGINTALPKLLWCVLESLASRYDALLKRGPAELLESYREASCIVGKRVRIWEESTDSLCESGAWPAPLASGVVSSIEDDLSLRIEGVPTPVGRGRLALEEACEALGI